MSINKIISLNKLGSFLTECKKIFAPIIHAHKLSDITDYTVDSALSSSSINPVQNKVLNAEFDAIQTAFDVYTDALNTCNTEMTNGDVATLKESKSYTDDLVGQKTTIQMITWEAND